MTSPRTDIAEAKASMNAAVGIKNALRDLEAKLWDGERVECMANGQYGKLPGVITLTSQRILLVANTMGASQSTHYLLEDIRDIEQTVDIMHGAVTVHTAGGSAGLAKMNRKESKRFAAAAQNAIAARTQTNGPNSTSVADQLLKLKQLHDAGVLTDEQYEAKSAPLIARL